MKKLNKFFAVLVALAMMATLCVSMAFAQDEVPAPAPEDAKLVKYLQAGEGVVVPEGMTFNFTLTPIAGNPAEVAEVTVEIPVSAMTQDENGDYIGSKTLAEIFADTTFSKPGEYKFTADEVATTWTAADGESLVEDQDTFEVHLYVKNDGNGTAIDKVTVTDGTDKVDPTEIKDKADDGQDDQGKNIGFSFTNTFKKDLIDNNDEDDTGIIDLTKTVTGNYGDKTYKFPFEFTYTLPAANQSDVKYKVLKDGAHEKDVAEQTAENNKIEVTLGHGDKLIITQAPQGLKWATEEKIGSVTDLQNVDKYTTTANGDQATTTAEEVLTTTGAANYVNDIADDDVTPTGILVSNLPYIALALVAIGGLVAYVVVRRRDSENA